MVELTTLIFKHEFEQAKRYIISYKPNLNYVTTKGDTPLLAAIDSGNIDMVEFLLKNGADPNFLDSRINTPLIEAIEIAVENNDYLEKGKGEPNLDIINIKVL